MNSLFTQLSGLVGLLVFLGQLWNNASLERCISIAAWSALIIYVMLVGIHLIYLRASEPPPLSSETASSEADFVDNPAASETEAATEPA